MKSQAADEPVDVQRAAAGEKQSSQPGMVQHIERFLKVNECCVSNNTSREEIVDQSRVSQSRVVASEASLCLMQLCLAALIKVVD